MAGRPILSLPLNPGERRELEQRATDGNPPESQRAQIILCRAEGLSQAEVAQKLGCSERCVVKWTSRFRRQGLNGLQDASRQRRKAPKDNRRNRENIDELIRSNRPHSRGNPDTEAPRTDPFPKFNPGESDTADPAGSRATMREVATAAGVSKMTVSRVLNNHPNVRPELRNRVLRAVQATDYRPSPEVRKLMAHLRSQKALRMQGVVCSLQSKSWIAGTDSYSRAVGEGAKARAKSLGFAWETHSIEAFLENPASMSRMLYHRGVEGIFLAPPPIPLANFSPGKATRCWDHFSVITTTFAIKTPLFRKVLPDHFRNMISICTGLVDRGYQRIGLAIPEHLDQRVLHHFSGGFLAFHLATKRKMLQPHLYGPERDPDHLCAWFQNEKPDAIIVSSSQIAPGIAETLKLAIPGPVAFAALAFLNQEIAGINELPERIGSIAMETLGAMITHNEKGIPSEPVTTMVSGVWQDGISAPDIASRGSSA